MNKQNVISQIRFTGAATHEKNEMELEILPVVPVLFLLLIQKLLGIT